MDILWLVRIVSNYHEAGNLLASSLYQQMHFVTIDLKGISVNGVAHNICNFNSQQKSQSMLMSLWIYFSCLELFQIIIRLEIC